MPKEQQGLQIIQHLGQTYRVMQAAFSSRVGHALPRWRILLTLHECGQCSQKLLAERCRLDPASLTRLLQAMQQQGWITRSADPNDNRVTNATLTAAGQAVVNEALPRRAAFFEESLQGLSNEEIQALTHALDVLERNFAQAAVPRAESGG
ncbi:MarR family winged helix-turn-helix transcriptional regulator [Bordetella petrii]|uniref:MarR family winged helix-turn-helix transcriptional regulator n=1 Tax=Bordetella petrii TaxID=94624 RepID=UPI001E44D01A|nr:MarR family transcriptional regulator [Bordetella petrii]MCD0504932.1 MarR family transcriptional regulator [Bordetella petrii]